MVRPIRKQSSRKQPRKSLSPLQQSRLKKITVFMVVAALLWFVFSPGSGLLALFADRAELQDLQEQTKNLVEKNQQLEKEINLLEESPEHLEEIARRDYGLLKKNERVYDFSRPQEKPKK